MGASGPIAGAYITWCGEVNELRPFCHYFPVSTDRVFATKITILPKSFHYMAKLWAAAVEIELEVKKRSGKLTKNQPHIVSEDYRFDIRKPSVTSLKCIAISWL